MRTNMLGLHELLLYVRASKNTKKMAKQWSLLKFGKKTMNKGLKETLTGPGKNPRTIRNSEDI